LNNNLRYNQLFNQKKKRNEVEEEVMKKLLIKIGVILLAAAATSVIFVILGHATDLNIGWKSGISIPAGAAITFIIVFVMNPPDFGSSPH